jgi:DNA-binding transcriptional ArsR family regulator
VPSRLAVLEVIADPTRRRILDAVRGGERSVGELVEWLEPYRAELAGRLDSLERHLERTARPIPPKERSS